MLIKFIFHIVTFILLAFIFSLFIISICIFNIIFRRNIEIKVQKKYLKIKHENFNAAIGFYLRYLYCNPRITQEALDRLTLQVLKDTIKDMNFMELELKKFSKLEQIKRKIHKQNIEKEKGWFVLSKWYNWFEPFNWDGYLYT